jgi:hypothetical protein
MIRKEPTCKADNPINLLIKINELPKLQVPLNKSILI